MAPNDSNDENKHDREIAAKLFGRVGKIKATGNPKVNKSMLLAPIEGGTGFVIHMFCTGCGAYGELSRSYTAELLGSTEEMLPESLDDKYLERTGCHYCKGGATAVLKDIPSSDVD